MSNIIFKFKKKFFYLFHRKDIFQADFFSGEFQNFYKGKITDEDIYDFILEQLANKNDQDYDINISKNFKILGFNNSFDNLTIYDFDDNLFSYEQYYKSKNVFEQEFSLDEIPKEWEPIDIEEAEELYESKKNIKQIKIINLKELKE